MILDGLDMSRSTAKKHQLLKLLVNLYRDAGALALRPTAMVRYHPSAQGSYVCYLFKYLLIINRKFVLDNLSIPPASLL